MFLVSSGIVACACGGGAEPEPVPLTLRAGDSGRTVEVVPGQAIVIRLESNPGTGYEWAIGPLDEDVVAEETHEFVVDSDADGEPGEDVIRFRAVDTGRTDLRLSYRRPWETDAEPLGTFLLDVVVL